MLMSCVLVASRVTVSFGALAVLLRIATHDLILSVCLVQTECGAFHLGLIWCCFEC